MENENSAAKEETGLIRFEAFDKVDLRVGRILECHKHPDADKLLIFKIDLGSGDIRQIVSSIAEFYQPEQLTGRSVVVVANLKPSKFRGEISQGMILTGEWGGCQLKVLEADGIPAGTRIN